MTEKQAKRRYFPEWNATARQHSWRMANGRLVGQRMERFGGPETTQIYNRIWEHAEQRASDRLRAVLPDDLRHGVHMAALGRDKSSHDLKNAELDRVIIALKLMRDPDNMHLLIAWDHPEQGERRRRLWWLRNRCNPAYRTKVCRDMYGTEDIDALDNHQVEVLYGRLKHREHAARRNYGAPNPARP